MDDTMKSNGTAAGLRRRDLLQGILATSVSAIMIAGPDGIIHFANQRASEVLGVPIDDVLGRSCMDPAWSTETPDGHPLPFEDFPFNIVQRTGRPLDNGRISVLDAAGQRRQLSLNAAPLPGSEDIVFSIVDVTAEEDMKAARNRLLEILEATPDFVSMSDLDHNVVYMNAAARRLRRALANYFVFEFLALFAPEAPLPGRVRRYQARFHGPFQVREER